MQLLINQPGTLTELKSGMQVAFEMLHDSAASGVVKTGLRQVIPLIAISYQQPAAVPASSNDMKSARKEVLSL